MGKRLLLIVSFCVVEFSAGLFRSLLFPEESPDEEEREEEKREVVSSPPVVVKRDRASGWEEGKLVWLLQAQDMELNNDNTKAICRGGVKLIVYQEEKKNYYSGSGSGNKFGR